jgi:hypothetical protein
MKLKEEYQVTIKSYKLKWLQNSNEVNGDKFE